MKKLDSLKKITTKPELSKLLGVKSSTLTYILYKLKPNTQYRQFEIPKRNGCKRVIHAPFDRLKNLQSSLSFLLQDCIDEINAVKFPKSEINHPKALNSKVLKVKISNSEIKQQPSLSHGFVRHRSTITNAMMHLNQKNVLNIDLKDFFGSFNFGRVRGFFIKNRNFELNSDIATVIAQIACYENKLPQGSPCSPVITNLITHSLDIRLASLAKKHSCIYSRYADDITFSTRKSVFPRQIMRQKESGEYNAGKKLTNEITRAGFSINDKKTRIQYKDSRQDVTGLVVNKKPNVKKEYWRTVRSQCHSLFRTGSFTKKVADKKVEGNINELEGQLNFIDQIDRYNRMRQKPALNPKYALERDLQKHLKQTKHLLCGREKTFSRFLYYRLFYANDKPTFLCEGKTDNVYLKSAISKLVVHYPSLATPKTRTKDYELVVRFVEYSSRTRFLLELCGGVDYLKGFIGSFENLSNFYKAPKPKHPVIVILDNDEGPKGLLQYVANFSSAKIFPSTLDIKKEFRKSEFIRVANNLYIVLTPLSPKDEQTDIEYLFNDATRLKQHNGKCFNTVDKRDEKIDLSKDSFASHIIKAQKSTINFNGLKPLLDRVVAAIAHYDSIKNL